MIPPVGPSPSFISSNGIPENTDPQRAEQERIQDAIEIFSALLRSDNRDDQILALSQFFEAIHQEDYALVQAWKLARGPLNGDMIVTALGQTFSSPFRCFLIKECDGLTEQQTAECFKHVAQCRQIDLLQALFDKGCSPDARTVENLTLMHLIAMFGFDDAIPLVHRKAPHLINAQNTDGESPLFYALHHGNTETVRVLLKWGANPSQANKTGVHALHYAAQIGRGELIADICNAGVDIHSRDDLGNTPLMYGVRSMNFQVVQTLLQLGADIGCCNVAGHSPLHWAAEQGFDEIIPMLARLDLLQQQTLDTRDSPRERALLKGHISTAMLLDALKRWLSAGGSIADFVMSHQSELRASESSQIVETSTGGMYHHESDLNARGADGKTPLIKAICAENKEEVSRLLQAGADPERPDAEGIIPIVYASSLADPYILDEITAFLMSKQQ